MALLCVKSSVNFSQFLENFVGLLQGEVVSPMLITHYVNDLENVFLEKPIELNCLSLFNIMVILRMVIYVLNPQMSYKTC